MTTKFKDVAIRAFKTFWQAALAYVVTSLGTTGFATGDFTAETMKTAGTAIVIGGVAAGLSAVYNAFFKPYVDTNIPATSELTENAPDQTTPGSDERETSDK